MISEIFTGDNDNQSELILKPGSLHWLWQAPTKTTEVVGCQKLSEFVTQKHISCHIFPHFEIKGIVTHFNTFSHLKSDISTVDSFHDSYSKQ